MLNKNIIKNSLKDFLSPQILSISFLPFIITLLILLSLYILFSEPIFLYFQNIFYIDEHSYPKLAYIFSFEPLQWLFKLFSYIVGIVLVVLLSVIISIIIIGFFTPKIVKIIHLRHYAHLKMPTQNISIFYTIFLYIKTIFIFVVMFIVLLPFMFIPFINIIAVSLPFYYLFHNFLILDVGLTVNSKKEFQTILKKHKLQLYSTTLPLYLISLIPFAAIIFQILFVVVLAHFFFLKKAT